VSRVRRGAECDGEVMGEERREGRGGEGMGDKRDGTWKGQREERAMGGQTWYYYNATNADGNSRMTTDQLRNHTLQTFYFVLWGLTPFFLRQRWPCHSNTSWKLAVWTTVSRTCSCCHNFANSASATSPLRQACFFL
jgi:hypothetical protein